MTTSSESSVTKCGEMAPDGLPCARAIGHFAPHDSAAGYRPFVPAPAPSSDPVCECVPSVMDTGDGVIRGRDRTLCPVHTPVLSPTEAGPHEHDVPMSAMDGRGHEHRKFIEPPNDESVAEFRARWRTAAFDGIDDRNRAKKFAQLANAEAESAWVSGARWGADWMLAHLREEARRGR